LIIFKDIIIYEPFLIDKLTLIWYFKKKVAILGKRKERNK
jgi:hypothetical protein